MKKSTLIFLVVFCLGCSHQPTKINIAITLNSDHTLAIKGFDKSVIADIGRDSNNAAWQSLLPVYKMPADTDMKDFQTAQPGNYKVKDSLVIFTPDTAFKKGQAYFLRSYQFDNTEDAVRSITGRKRTGHLSYKDLIFRY